MTFSLIANSRAYGFRLAFVCTGIVIEITKLKPKLNLRLKLWKGLGSPVIDVTVIDVTVMRVRPLKHYFSFYFYNI